MADQNFSNGSIFKISKAKKRNNYHIQVSRHCQLTKEHHLAHFTFAGSFPSLTTKVSPLQTLSSFRVAFCRKRKHSTLVSLHVLVLCFLKYTLVVFQAVHAKAPRCFAFPPKSTEIPISHPLLRDSFAHKKVLRLQESFQSILLSCGFPLHICSCPTDTSCFFVDVSLMHGKPRL